MAPSKGAARRDFWKDREPVEMLLTVALVSSVSDISALPIGELAHIFGRGISEAIIRWVLVIDAVAFEANEIAGRN
jgi:hypothetical protein